MRSAARLAVLFAGVLFGKDLVPGPQVLTLLSEVDDTDQPYALYLPRRFDASRKYPLVISLHEEGTNHRLSLRRVFGRGNRLRETDSEAANGPFPPFPDVDFLVAAPLARGTLGYQGLAEKDVYDVLADIKKHFLIDEDRLYLTGSSMGGGGTLWLGLTRPDIWAAIAPVCPSPPPEAEELAANAINVPVRLFQGMLDPVVPAAQTRAWRERLEAAGARVEYTEFPTVKHNAWDYAYRNASIFRWFAANRRQPFPQRVRFSTRSYEYPSAYWVQLDNFLPGNLASIDARFTEFNQIEIQTSGIDAFTLRPNGHALYDAASAVALTIDGAAIKVARRGEFSFSRTPSGWKAEPFVRPAGAKGPGSEGPISEAIGRRHLYVYGTADSPEQEELARRRNQAERAANWLKPPARLLLSLRAVADSEVTEADARNSDLVLFGTQATNRLIASFAGRLPLELNPSAADYGLLFIASAGGRYVLVNSGLVWWTGAPASRLPFELLPALGDYVLFKGSVGHVVAEGRFDRDWKVPAGQAARLAAAGVVQVR
jgi:poly(3-hydroxybutyrate) depolymerase